MERGYVKLWRKLLDSGLLANGPAWQLLGYLLLNATHKPYRKVVGGMAFDLQPGDVIFGRKRAADDLNLSEKQVRTALKLLEKLEIVASNPTNKCTVISFVNWGIYQDSGPAEGPTEGQQRASNGPATGQQRATRQTHKHITHNTEEEIHIRAHEGQQCELPLEEKPKAKKGRKPKGPKMPFGRFQNVKLTQEEHDKLMQEYGEPFTGKIIDRLDTYIGSNGDKYKSHYMTMHSWVIKAVQEDERRITAQGNQYSGNNGRRPYVDESKMDYSRIPKEFEASVKRAEEENFDW